MDTGIFIFGSSHDMPDIFYASGFNCTDAFIYFSCGATKAIIVPALEHERACQEVKKGIKVFERREFIAPEKKRHGESLQEVLNGLFSKFKAKKWIVPGRMPCALLNMMRKAGAKVEIAAYDIFPQRHTKSESEIALIAKSLQNAEAAMHCAVKLIAEAKITKNGTLVVYGEKLSSEFLRRQINIELVRNGGVACGTIAASGKQAAEPHNVGHGLIKAGECIIIDIFPRDEASGYWGDITRTFVKGKAPDIVKKAYAAVKEARDSSSQMVKAGAIPEQIMINAQNVLEKHGFKTGRKNGVNYGFFHSLGHGVGLEIHENPKISLNNNTPLKKGNVITIEPGLYYPEWGGVRLEDIVSVEINSAKKLTKFPDFLEIE